MKIFKNDVGRPSNETIKKRNIFKGISLLLLLVVILLIVYILNREYGFLEKTNLKNNKNITTIKEENIKKEVDVNEADRIIKEILGEQFYYDFAYSSENEIIFNNKYYRTTLALEKTKEKSSDYSCKDFFGNDLKYYSDSSSPYSWRVEDKDFSGLCYDKDGLEYYSYDDVNNTYKKLFNDNSDAVKDNINRIFTDIYAYSKNKNSYVKLSCECGDGGYTPIYGVVSSYNQDNKLYIDVVIGFADTIVDDSVLKLKDGTSVTLKDYETNDKEIYKKYQDNMDKYSFEFSTTGGDYKLVEVKKVN